MCERIDFSRVPTLIQAILTIRGSPVTVVGIVVVQVTRSIDVTDVVAVARVRGERTNNCQPKEEYLCSSDFFQLLRRF